MVEAKEKHLTPTQNKSILGKGVARLLSVQALFQMEASDNSLSEILLEFETHRLGCTYDGHQYYSPDKKLFNSILSQVIKNQKRIDVLINISLKTSWQLERIDPTLRSIFRAFTAELLMKQTKPKVIISEFLNVTQAFFPQGKEIGLTNGVLDFIARNLNLENNK